jgi:acyl carrier protein
MADSIETQVIAMISKKRKTDPATVTLDSTFAELGIDSLDATDLIFAFEDTFGIVVPDDQAQTMKTVRDVVDGVTRLVHERAGA